MSIKKDLKYSKKRAPALPISNYVKHFWTSHWNIGNIYYYLDIFVFSIFIGRSQRVEVYRDNMLIKPNNAFIDKHGSFSYHYPDPKFVPRKDSNSLTCITQVTEVVFIYCICTGSISWTIKALIWVQYYNRARITLIDQQWLFILSFVTANH